MQTPHVDSFLKLRKDLKKEALGELSFTGMISLNARRIGYGIRNAYKTSSTYGTMMLAFATWMVVTLSAHDLDILAAYSMYFVLVNILHFAVNKFKFTRNWLIGHNLKSLIKLHRNYHSDELIKLRYLLAVEVAETSAVIETETDEQEEPEVENTLEH